MLILVGHMLSKHRPVSAASRFVGVHFSAGPADFVVQPFGYVQIDLAVQAVPKPVEEKQSAVGLAFDFEKSVVGVLVAGSRARSFRLWSSFPGDGCGAKFDCSTQGCYNTSSRGVRFL